MKTVNVSPTNQVFESMSRISDKESIAEIVDNSIGKAFESDKSCVSIDVNYDSDTVEIVDNAGGITRNKLKDLFTLGESTLNSEKGTNNHFGVGLKSAVISLTGGDLTYHVASNPESQQSASKMKMEVYNVSNYSGQLNASYSTVESDIESGTTKIVINGVSNLNLQEIKKYLSTRFQMIIDGYQGLKASVSVNGSQLKPNLFIDHLSCTPFWFYPRIYPDVPVNPNSESNVNVDVHIGRLHPSAPDYLCGTSVMVNGILIEEGITDGTITNNCDTFQFKPQKNRVFVLLNFKGQTESVEMPFNHEKNKVPKENPVISQFIQNWGSKLIDPLTYKNTHLIETLIEPFESSEWTSKNFPVKYGTYSYMKSRRHGDEAPQWNPPKGNGIKQKSEKLIRAFKDSSLSNDPITHDIIDEIGIEDSLIRETVKDWTSYINEYYNISDSNPSPETTPNKSSRAVNHIGNDKQNETVVASYHNKSQNLIGDGYLDKMFNIYDPMPKEREVDQNKIDTIEVAFESGDPLKVLDACLELDRFPIDCSFTELLNQSSINNNTESRKRIGKYLYDLGFEEIVRRLKQPIPGNRQMGAMFQDYLQTFEIPKLSTEEFSEIELEIGDVVLLNESDSEIQRYMEKEIGIQLDKAPDMLAKKKVTDGTVVHIPGEAKFISQPGGNQNHQIEDALGYCHKDVDKQVYPISIIDGYVWIEDTNLHKKIQNSNSPVTSILYLEDLLLDF